MNIEAMFKQIMSVLRTLETIWAEIPRFHFSEPYKSCQKFHTCIQHQNSATSPIIYIYRNKRQTYSSWRRCQEVRAAVDEDEEGAWLSRGRLWPAVVEEWELEAVYVLV